MKRVVFSLANGVDGEIVLADNLFTEFWSMVFKKHISEIPIRRNSRNPEYVEGFCSARAGTPNEQYYKRPEHAVTRQQNVEAVNGHIARLLELGADWQAGTLPETPDFADLNRIHRGFTTMMLTGTCTSIVPMTRAQLQEHKLNYFNMNVTKAWPYFFPEQAQCDFPPVLELPAKAEAMECLHLINSGVHEIENRTMYNPRHAVYNQAIVEQLPDTITDIMEARVDWDAKLEDGCTDSQKLDWNFESAYHQAVFSTHDWNQNVYDLKNILGKDYRTCYFDHDDPFNFDITNTAGTTKGGFEICPGYELFHKNILRPWMREWGFDPRDSVTRPIPIGRIDPDFVLEHFGIHTGQDPLQRNKDMRIVNLDLIS